LKKFVNSRVALGAVLAAVMLAVGATGASAAHLIGSKDIKNGSIRSADIHDGAIKPGDLSDPVRAQLAQVQPQTQPQQAAQGQVLLKGAYYSVAFYDVGDTNAGAIATVACKATTDVAISGGVQVTDFSRNTPVSSSFPGRMDWSANAPKPDRLDGWIVQFGGNAGATSDKDPLREKVWALCVPHADVTTEQTYTQSAG
jgi:hypothetical protein